MGVKESNRYHNFSINSPALTRQEEEYLKNWIIVRAQRGTCVTRADVQKKAKQISKNEQFQASWGWLQNFKKRNADVMDYIWE